MKDEITDAAISLIRLCVDQKMTVATAESCTGGLVAGAITEIPGSSAIFDRGFVTYSNSAKQQMLGVSLQTLNEYGAVSRQTAEEMAEGALTKSKVDLAVSITGIAGPDGGTKDKPVGLVHFAAVSRNGTTMHVVKRFADVDRAQVRQESVLQALRMLKELAHSEIARNFRIKAPEPPKPRVIRPWPDKMRKI